MQIELKLLDSNVNTPVYATEGAAGIDLEAAIPYPIEIPPLKTALIRTGISINMQTVPLHLMATILPRSGKGAKEGKVLGNLVGIVDQDYHGEVLVSLWNRNSDIYVTINPGEKFAQLVFVPVIKPTFKVVEEFSSTTDRGEGGFGSTDGK
jgi:dUTP pyrophosphatase